MYYRNPIYKCKLCGDQFVFKCDMTEEAVGDYDFEFHRCRNGAVGLCELLGFEDTVAPKQEEPK